MDRQKVLRGALSEALASWLTFEHHAGREELFSERYLALPIAQVLINNVSGKVIAEHNHPILKQTGKTGRPPQLDYAVQEDGKITLVLESKWAAARGISVQDVVWDCVRLELAANYYNCDAIFVLAGTRAQIDKVLSSPSFNPLTSRGKPTPVLGLNGIGRMSLNIESPKRAFGPQLRKILALYKNVKWPRSFVCGYGTQTPRDAKASQYTAAVWSIKPEAAVKRFTFTVSPAPKTKPPK